jgi:2-polyprenyl-3-methyl-5-hydroxy-6-metoxy-1,4-benzoquinol methylase
VSIYTQEVARLGGLGASHLAVLGHVAPGSVVLDVGCAGGYLAEALIARGAAAVDGLELDEAASVAARSACRRVLVGSVEDTAVVESLADATYDAIVLADVIEHLHHAEDVMTALVPKLTRKGRFVLSVPNIAHYSMRIGLLRGRFRYQDTGLLDRTHVRFFTRETLAELLASVGLIVEREELIFRGIPSAEAVGAIPTVGPALARGYDAVTRRCGGLLAYQFVIAAAPAG